MGKVRKETRKSSKKQNDVIILNHQLQQQRLIKANRYLISAVFVLMSLVFSLGFFIMPDENDMIETLQNKQRLAALSAKNPVISAEIDSLKGEMVALVSGSIESKLKSLEESIKLGSVLGSLHTLQAVRNDVTVLHKYSDPLEQKQQQVAQANVALLEEISQLRSLIYLTLGSSSLMLGAGLLIWFKKRKRLTYQKDEHYLPRVREDV